MAIFSFHQIVDETVALSQQMIDERILATWTERPSTQCVAMSISIDSEDQFQRNNCMHEWQI
jgi:UV DNA damage repair endonuclease